MGFSFSGIFTNTNDKAVIEAAKLQWPFCIIYKVLKPFEGIAIYREPEMIAGTFIQSYQEKDRIEDELPAFSSRFPETTFIHLWTDCHGGDCYYDGLACRNGKILIDNRGKGPGKFSREYEREKLRKVVKTLGVYIGGGYFEPFERDFFDNKENIIYPGKKSVQPAKIENKKSWWKFWQ